MSQPESLAARVWWGLVASVAFGLALAGSTAWFSARWLLYREVDQSLTMRAQHLARLPGPPPGHHRHRHQRPQRVPGVLISVGIPGQVPEFRSEDWPPGLPTTAAADGQLVTVVDDAGKAYRWLRVRHQPPPRPPPRPPDERPPGRRRPPPPPADSRIVVAAALAGVERDLLGLALVLAATAVVVLAGAILVAGRLRDGLLAPLGRLGQAIDDLPPDDLDARLDSGPLPPELARLATRLDALLTRLGQARARERRTIADIAHELRTPLAALKSDLGFAVAGGEVAPERARALEAQVDVLTERVDRLLLLARLEAGRQALGRQSVLLAEAVLDAWVPHANSDTELVLDGPAEAEIAADPGLLRVCLANLLGNAVAHASSGPISVTVTAIDRGWRLTIANPAEDLEPGSRDAAFDPFWRADASRAGTLTHSGLGLSLVRRIAEAHGAISTALVDEKRRFVVHLDWPRESHR